MRVCSVRTQKGIAPYQEGERKGRGEVTLNEAADILAISPSTVLRMIGNGLLPAQQSCKGAPGSSVRLHCIPNRCKEKPTVAEPVFRHLMIHVNRSSIYDEIA